jgi:Amt family ammonium transporter
MILTGALAKDVGLVNGHWHTFLMHLVALVVVGVFSFGGSWLLYKLVDAIIPLRVSHEEEELGLDLSQHGESVGEVGALPMAEGKAREPAKSGAPGALPVPA